MQLGKLLYYSVTSTDFDLSCRAEAEAEEAGTEELAS